MSNLLDPIPEARLILDMRPQHERPCCRTSFDADALLRPLFAGVVADPKLIYCAALKCLASSIIVCHNHPSGQLRPSEEDIRLTRKLLEAGKLLDIAFQDHLILTREGYYSFADMGML